MNCKRNVMIPMRDGTRLATDIYTPEANGRYPLVLERTPYNKENATMMWSHTHTHLLEQGYAVAIQDTRGRFASEGTWFPLVDDGWGANRDGYDTVAWLGKYVNCDGVIGSFGGSYSGNTQYLMAPTKPPGLKCMFVRQGSADLTEEWIYRGGALELGLNLHWGTQESISAFANRSRYLTETLTEKMEDAYEQLPILSGPQYIDPFEWLKEFFSHPPEDQAFWDKWNFAKHHSEVDIPMLHFGAWYDIFIRATIANFAGIAETGATETARSSQRLFVGPWMHGPLVSERFMRRVGELDFGPAAVIDFNQLVQRWFDHWLKGQRNGVDSEPPITMFEMGTNSWKKLTQWPPADVQPTKYYLHKGPSGSATSLNDGVLSATPSTGSQSGDDFIYDPKRPTRTRGGCTLYALPSSKKDLPKDLEPADEHMAELGLQAGPRDQRPVEDNCLTYSTEVLAEDVHVTGPVVVQLHISSTAEDTDFVAKLTDVWPDGRSILITDGIQRARYRNSKVKPVPLKPGTVNRVSIDLWATSNVFKKGHRIRVSVSSSNFPRYNRNLNVLKPNARIEDAVVATNTVYHDEDRPSCIVLPIIKKG
jgi:putative CocE/NonD family hydrolase